MNPAVLPPVVQVNISTPATFHCTSGHPSTVSISWFVGGVPQDESDSNEIQVNYSEETRTGTLKFVDPQLAYNGTIVQCQVHYSFGLAVNSTRGGLLIVLGERLSTCAQRENPGKSRRG